MPLFKVISRGNLHLSKTEVIPSGKTCEMSQAHADSLPPGVVELVVESKSVPPKSDAPKVK